MTRAMLVLWFLTAFAFGCLFMAVVLIHPGFVG
jgi:hypothetical protein